MSKEYPLKKIQERITKNFMDMIVLAELRNRAMSGWDVISYIYNRYHLYVTAGILYSTLYSMEREGLIEGKLTEGRTIYTLTKKGKEVTKSILATDVLKQLVEPSIKSFEVSFDGIKVKDDRVDIYGRELAKNVFYVFYCKEMLYTLRKTDNDVIEIYEVIE